ncbi:MAG TPA: hypothetical protein VGB60_12760 [Brevundimonas sp.]|jgi:hypothetical protein|uniref:hypothetical protein n=1 Tax=Brevundimonas sp. TaxID=1871086 RepID=UPI002EDBAFCA
MTALVEGPKPSILRKAALFVLLAGLGGAVGFVGANMTDGVLTAWEDEVAVLMSVVLIATGLISAVVVAVRPSTVPKGCGLLQVAVMLLAGVMFLLPVFGSDWASAEIVFGGVLALLALQSAANLMLWRAADEMLRRIMSETSAMAFWAAQLGLFVYAAAERLGLVQSVSAWGMMGLLMGVYFICSIIAAARRGIH